MFGLEHLPLSFPALLPRLVVMCLAPSWIAHLFRQSFAAWGAFAAILTLQGAWWIWGMIIVTEYHRTQPNYDWVDAGFGRGFAWFLLMVMSFQLNYMYLYANRMLLTLIYG